MFSALTAARRRLGLATGAMLAVGSLAVPAGALAGVDADPGGYGNPYGTLAAPTLAAPTPAPAAPAPATPAPARGADVTIGNLAFAAPDVTISRGQSVTWIWSDGPHNVHVLQGPEQFDSGIKAAGARFTRALTVPGVYAYQCDVHPSMRGQITVTA